MNIDAELLRRLRLTAGLPDDLRARIAAALSPVHVPGGSWLFRQGDPGHAMYLVHTGRLRVVRTIAGSDQVVGLLQSGDSFGEIALLQGGTRAASIQAVRDSHLLALSHDDLTELMTDRHFASALLAQVTALLRSDPPVEDPADRRSIVAVVGTDPRTAAATTAGLHAALTRQAISAAVLQEDDLDPGTGSLTAAASARLDQLEEAHRVVLLDGGTLGSPWSRLAARQADRVLVVPGPDAALLPTVWPDLEGCILVVAGDRPPSTERLDGLGRQLRPTSHARVRDSNRAGDLARLARRLAGRSLGIVLSGGGARGLAHIGVLQAVEEAGLTIDRFGGTSMGAFISAAAARGMTGRQIERVFMREVVRRNPFRDYTLPRRALIRGVTAERMLRRVLGRTDVRHLAYPWFAASAALHDATLVVHRDGPLWEGVACSMSLPGLAPPRLWRGRVVVDGGVLDNMPVQTMAADAEGQVIAVDLTRPEGTRAGATPTIPGIVSTLSAIMTLSSLQVVERNRQQAHLVIEPRIADVELLDFAKATATIDAGYRAAQVALAAQSGSPVEPTPHRSMA